MSRTSRSVSLARRFRLAVLPLLLLSMLVLAVSAAPTLGVGQPVRTAEECANAECHPGGPDGPPAAQDPAPEPTVVALSKPSVSRKPRARKPIRVGGTIGAAHETPAAVRLEFARKVGKQFRVAHSVDVTLTPGSTSYTATVKLRKGSWRVRARHEDATHLASASGYRTFTVK